MTSDLASVLANHTSGPGVPLFGAVSGIWRSGQLVDSAALGWARAYDYSPAGQVALLAPDERIPVSRDTVFDIASLTKLFTATTAMRLVDEGVVDLDEPVGPLLPEFVNAGRGTVTLRHLLTHTAGLPEDHPLWGIPNDQRLTATLTLPSTTAVGTFSYSCVGYVAAGTVLERATGATLADLVASRIAAPLALASTRFGPVPDAAATEYEPWAGRGMVSGEAHDEMAWALGGVAGNAGLFSTLDDLGAFANSFLTGALLSAAALEQMTNPSVPAPGFAQAVGFRVNAPAFMGALASPATIGHTGFTGTSIVIDREHDLVAIALSNRVHPTRDGADSTSLRVDVAAQAARWL